MRRSGAKPSAEARPKESVWDYPRPPRIEALDRRVRIEHGGEVIAESDRAVRVLETASPPTVYIPAEDVRTDLLTEVPSKHTFCEWKGHASYYDLEVSGNRSEAAAWFYAEPRDAFAELKDRIAFYAGRVDAAYLGDERVRPQGGTFYGGWVTDEIQGPFKGEPGSEGW
jgi:uncharacterized protein (DUF427 family)